MRFGPGVDTQFSHGSDTSTECAKMTKQKHSPLFRVQLDNLFCALFIQIKGYKVKTSLIFNESSHFLNFAPCVSPSYQMLDLRKKSGQNKIQRHIFCIGYLMNVKIYF